MTKSADIAKAWAQHELSKALSPADKAMATILTGKVAELFGSGPGEFYAAEPVEPGRVTIEEWQDLTEPKE